MDSRGRGSLYAFDLVLLLFILFVVLYIVLCSRSFFLLFDQSRIENPLLMVVVLTALG